MTLNVDLAPTFIAAAQHSAPTGMQGQDLSPLYLSATPAHWRTAFFYEHATIGKVSSIPSSQALVQRDTKYIYWPDFGYEEWFDLNTDPSESHNLVDHPGRAAELVQLRSRFNALKQQSR
jgi:arylsulfatase A-like enzyme